METERMPLSRSQKAFLNFVILPLSIFMLYVVFKISVIIVEDSPSWGFVEYPNLSAVITDRQGAALVGLSRIERKLNFSLTPKDSFFVYHEGALTPLVYPDVYESGSFLFRAEVENGSWKVLASPKLMEKSKKQDVELAFNEMLDDLVRLQVEKARLDKEKLEIADSWR